jgi:ATP-binding cassette, subfamily B, bacterial PglK
VLKLIAAIRQTLRLLAPQPPMRWLLLVLLAMVATAFEAMGASLIYVFVRLLSAGEAPVVLPAIGDVSAWLPDVPRRTLQRLAAALVAAFFIVRSAVILGQHYVQARLVHNAGARLSNHLLRGYLSMPYLAHTQLNSSELVRNAYDSVQSLVREVIKPAVEVVVEVVVVIGLVGVLLVAAPQATLVALVAIAPTVFLLQALVQPRIKRLGRTAQESRRATLQAMQQALGGVRDIRLLGREDEFSRAFASQRRIMARADYMKTALSELPRTVIETFLVFAILAAFVASMASGDFEGTAAALSVFAYVGLRLQPSLRKIVQGLNHIRFGSAVIEDLLEDRARVDAALNARRTLPNGSAKGAPLERAIELRHVGFAYAPGAPEAVHGIDLTIRKGEFIGICGPTGSGKSTIVDLISGLLQPTAGAVLVDGRPLEEHPAWWYAQLGVVSQSVYLTDDTIRRNLAFGRDDSEIDDELLRRCIERAQLQDVIDGLPHGLDTLVGERGVRLSGGQRQRVAVARALYRVPSVIIFDEGTAALDTATEAALVSAVDELKNGRTLISVAHRISTVRHADRIVLVQGGRIVADGSYEELLDRSPLFRALAR